jgi:aspartokinase
MEPAIESRIPIFIRNTFEPQLAGTRIYLPSTKVWVCTRCAAVRCFSSCPERTLCDTIL